MSKYIVIYSYTYTKEVARTPDKYFIAPPTKTEHYYGFGVKEFENYEEAYNFSVKKQGYVLKPIEPIITAED